VQSNRSCSKLKKAAKRFSQAAFFRKGKKDEKTNISLVSIFNASSLPSRLKK